MEINCDISSPCLFTRSFFTRCLSCLPCNLVPKVHTIPYLVCELNSRLICTMFVESGRLVSDSIMSDTNAGLGEDMGVTWSIPHNSILPINNPRSRHGTSEKNNPRNSATLQNAYPMPMKYDLCCVKYWLVLLHKHSFLLLGRSTDITEAGFTRTLG